MSAPPDHRPPHRPSAVVLLAAGQGTRMRTPWPKVLHPLCGRPLIGWVLEQALSLEPERVVLVLGDRRAEVERWLESSGELGRASDAGIEVVVVEQRPQRGTGHALQVCLPALAGLGGHVVVLYGDMPLLRRESLDALLAACPAGGASLLTAELADPTGYGRILRSADGGFEGIVEQRDATPAQRQVREVNVGVYALPLAGLERELAGLSDGNAQGELYLTDAVVGLARSGQPVAAVPLADVDEARGVNTLAELAAARALAQERILEAHLASGVLIEDPSTTYIDHGVRIGAGTHVLPCTVIRSGVVIGAGCEVGPFAHLRVGTVLEDGAEVGNFTECKQARLGAGAKAKHLSYLGDVRIGERANIGAGTIVANYDGKAKHQSEVGARAFIGSGTVLVAPAQVGADALTGAGAVVLRGTRIQDGEAWVGLPARKLREGRGSTAAEKPPESGT